jgi:hypothetical protein
MKIGFIFHLEPRHIFREDFQATVNRELAWSLNKLRPAELSALYNQHSAHDVTPDRSFPTIRILFSNKVSHTNDTADQPATTRSLIVECAHGDRHLVEHLLIQLTRRLPYFGTFITSSFARSQNQVSNFRRIVPAHNMSLSHHRAIPIAGISIKQMDELSMQNISLRDQLLALDGVSRVEHSPATLSIGKWYLFTEAATLTATEQLVEGQLKDIFESFSHRSMFPRFAYPKRLTSIEPPVDYVEAILHDTNATLANNTEPADDFLSLPNHTNAWTNGPPRNTDHHSTDSKSTMSCTAAQTMTTQMSDLRNLIEEQQKQFDSKLEQMQGFSTQQQAGADAKFDQRLETLISKSIDKIIEKLMPRLELQIDSKLKAYFPPS